MMNFGRNVGHNDPPKSPSPGVAGKGVGSKDNSEIMNLKPQKEECVSVALNKDEIKLIKTFCDGLTTQIAKGIKENNHNEEEIIALSKTIAVASNLKSKLSRGETI